ncbi:HAD family hydrolase [Sporolactobacillus nakayamae]|uniref:Cof subfamily of IIB subfamily of haloacid dehalogenase superfamily/HAD-superfamily hydrolase, subfamily IIB n=1 Tax=Sporolactobacillus nakayamae TaxID=269670 RepID=A0A1I2PJR4_9BACL|nr:HAD family hydrolase [Sporolactobacillus nakayamae]SFG16284.1 Cof subfamily of IIB subfamily of haloacid dehalogenase superfamily/HAD-superfamily hydrolase, subfamily IIB [Sporolactobacillus nakayamae]
MEPIKMIVSDLDHTLLNNQEMISDHMAHVLNQCQQKGIRVAFATARPERATRLFQKKIQPDYIIANNGATIVNNRQSIYNCLIPNELKNKLISELISLETVTCISIEAGDCLYTNYRGEPWDIEWNAVYTDFKKKLTVDTPKLSVECTDTAAMKPLMKKYPNLNFYANSGEKWYQIMRRDVTKMNGISFVAERLNVNAANIAAFGDDHNDLEMLGKCGVGVAVSNGIEKVKKAADFVCEKNEHDGVARWLEAHVL